MAGLLVAWKLYLDWSPNTAEHGELFGMSHLAGLAQRFCRLVEGGAAIARAAPNGLTSLVSEICHLCIDAVDSLLELWHSNS